jgi:phosphohistidine phosphatase SixA
MKNTESIAERLRQRRIAIPSPPLRARETAAPAHMVEADKKQ